MATLNNASEDGITADSLASPGDPTKRGRKVRRYRFACTVCKARKIRCNGVQPTCSNCRRSHSQCVWPEHIAAAGQLQEARDQIKRLEASLSLQEQDHQDRSHQGDQSPSDGADSAVGRPVAPSQAISPNVASDAGATSSVTPSAHTESGTQLWFQVGVGEDGTVIYNGPMSRFHAGALDESQYPKEADTSRTQIEALKSQYALMDSVWMPLIASRSYMGNSGVSPEAGMALLDIYWTWLHPLHNCVYRPSFITDLALGGPCCSDFLLTCIFGLAARHLPEHHPSFREVGKGERFIARAKELLLEEMGAIKPAIPTIQGLLIIGGRQCAAGKSSEGWLYTGMAIRMMKDIGLHLDIVRLAGVEKWTPAEMETRKRLYNSAYIWDKTLSLALGRPPSLTRKPYSTTEIFDKCDDTRLWKPVHAAEVIESFQPTLALNTSTFCSFCRLHEITTDMMLLFSNAPLNDGFEAYVEALDERITQWYEKLPSGLRIDEPTSLAQSPPPHIVSLNLMCHSLRILLRRPYVTSPDASRRQRALATCLEHSKMIHAIYTVYTRTFPHWLMTFQVSYCIYTAATVEAQELKLATSEEERNGAAARLSDAVQVLQNEASQSPGSGRSLDTIRRLLSSSRPPPVCPSRHQAEKRHVQILPTAAGGARNSRHGALQPASDTASRVEGDDVESASATSAYVSSGPANTGYTTANMGDGSVPFFALTGGGLWGDDYRFGGTNTGAGFQPDAFPWAVSVLDNGHQVPGLGSAWWHDPANRGGQSSH